MSNSPTEFSPLGLGTPAALPLPLPARGGANYARVFATFFRNSLVREMTFRGNLLITIVTRLFYFVAQVALFEIIYRQVNAINDWTRPEYFAFLATGMLINSLVETFFMPNCANFSELIRTGNLDFVLLKPIDPQFLISFEKMELAMLNQAVLALALLGYALVRIGGPIDPIRAAMYVLFVGVGVAFFYSLMLILASTSVWFGRNSGLYDFWFYIIIFARYPREIYGGSLAGDALQFTFSFMIPILLVVTVPSRVLLAKVLDPSWLTLVALAAAVLGLVVSRAIFRWSLRAYRSASS
ncbi:MAG TPA: ABC-2 family transporter protein [Planctomycetaceae bacterium]|nr:ABC-2 family transporter protein [Planctomycetaceae bacterium]